MSFNLLLSYAFHAKSDLAVIRSKITCGRVMIDSGAYTAFTKGYPVDLPGYAEYLTTWRGCWDHAITLDAIGDPITTRANTRKLHAMGIPVMPVFTRGDGLKEFDAMIRESRYVCVGGLVGMPREYQQPRIAVLQRRAVELGGGIHALGVSSTTVLAAARPYSADSSTVSSGFQFGTVTLFDGRTLRTLNIHNRRRLRENRDLLMAHGFPLGLIVSTTRMPGGAMRGVTMAAGATAFAVADEHLKTHYPTPGLGPDDAGPHLYNVAVQQGDARAMAGLDATLHGEDPPTIWRRYGSRHTCQRKAIA